MQDTQYINTDFSPKLTYLDFPPPSWLERTVWPFLFDRNFFQNEINLHARKENGLIVQLFPNTINTQSVTFFVHNTN